MPRLCSLISNRALPKRGRNMPAEGRNNETANDTIQKPAYLSQNLFSHFVIYSSRLHVLATQLEFGRDRKDG